MRRYPAHSRFRFHLHVIIAAVGWLLNGACALLALLIYAGVQ